VLHQLKTAGEQVIDLEDIAQHQGSAFGSMNSMLQPTQEQFENNLATQLEMLVEEKPVWIEDESMTIGKRFIPNPLFHQMRDARVIALKIPLEARVGFLVEEYGILDKDFLKACTEKIGKRLGPEQTKNAVAAIEEGRIADFIRIVLVYYDKTYNSGLSKREPETIIAVEGANTNAAINARLVLNLNNTQVDRMATVKKNDEYRNN